ncbi:hypothetical protein PFISCL1PPCAC_25405, partial [Pristionchus fissidentatus]
SATVSPSDLRIDSHWAGDVYRAVPSAHLTTVIPCPNRSSSYSRTVRSSSQRLSHSTWHHRSIVYSKLRFSGYLSGLLV